MEVDSQLHKSKCLSMEEKYFEEKRRNAKLDEMIREQENEIRKLNMYLKESDDYSKEIQQECHYLKQEVCVTLYLLSIGIYSKNRTFLVT